MQGFIGTLWGNRSAGDFKFTGIACIPAIPVIFEVNQKKVWTFYIYTLLRFFKLPNNFCGDFRRTCNPHNNYMHFTGYVSDMGIPCTFYGGKICSVGLKVTSCEKMFCFPLPGFCDWTVNFAPRLSGGESKVDVFAV